MWELRLHEKEELQVARLSEPAISRNAAPNKRGLR